MTTFITGATTSLGRVLVRELVRQGEAVAHRLRLNLENVPAVGDSIRDLEAAQAAGARPILVRTGKGAATEQNGIPNGVPVYDDLAAVADALLEPAA